MKKEFQEAKKAMEKALGEAEKQIATLPVELRGQAQEMLNIARGAKGPQDINKITELMKQMLHDNSNR